MVDSGLVGGGGKNGNDSIKRRNSLGHMAPLGLTGQLGLARIPTRAASTGGPRPYPTMPPNPRVVVVVVPLGGVTRAG